MKKSLQFILIFTCINILIIKPAVAIPPPDFIFTIGSQLIQFFSLAAIFLTTFFAASYQFLKIFVSNLKISKRGWFIFVLIIILLSLVAGYALDYYNQQQEYNKFIESNETKVYNLPTPTTEISQTPNPTLSSTQDAIVISETEIAEINPVTSNEELDELIKSNSDIVILDAREDEEYAIGYIPNSIHIRGADLIEGEWKKLPNNKAIYVLCWSGIRGKEVSDFLKSKGLNSSYLVDGVDGWVKYGGNWSGEIKFSKYYTEEQYTKLITLEELKSYIDSGVFIVDSRETDRYTNWHIQNSINIQIINTPSSKIDEVLAQIPANSKIISICDDVVNCFDGRILGVKVEKLGHKFIGRYNKPWEYRNQL